MKKALLIILLVSVHSTGYGHIAKYGIFGQLRASVFHIIKRSIKVPFFPRTPIIAPVQPQIDLKNPPSLMKAVLEHNHALINAALHAGVPLTELDEHGKNASGLAQHCLTEYDKYLVNNRIYSKEAFRKREEILKTVQVFDDFKRTQLAKKR